MENQPETCSLLLIVIVQDQDVELAQNALEEINLTPAILPSIGGFLEQKNNTLLIGCSKFQLTEVEGVLRENCRQRIEYLTFPMDNTSMNVPRVTPLLVSVGGATVFSIEVDYEGKMI